MVEDFMESKVGMIFFGTIIMICAGFLTLLVMGYIEFLIYALVFTAALSFVFFLCTSVTYIDEQVKKRARSSSSSSRFDLVWRRVLG